MFDWFSKKTGLESFCENMKVETAATQFEGNETEDGLRKALAILLLYSGYHFWQSIKESAELKKFTKDTNANVVIFETLVYGTTSRLKWKASWKKQALMKTTRSQKLSQTACTSPSHSLKNIGLSFQHRRF